MAHLAMVASLALAASVMACLEAPPGSSQPPPPGDASEAGGDASVDCPPACDTCEDQTCVIHCGEMECASGVSCPPGRPCHVTCEGTTACEEIPIDCTEATECNIECLGIDACQAGVSCDGTICTIECEGTYASPSATSAAMRTTARSPATAQTPAATCAATTRAAAWSATPSAAAAAPAVRDGGGGALV